MLMYYSYTPLFRLFSPCQAIARYFCKHPLGAARIALASV
jgi:hypothetical protein